MGLKLTNQGEQVEANPWSADEFYTIAEVCGILKISDRTVRRMIQRIYDQVSDLLEEVGFPAAHPPFTSAMSRAARAISSALPQELRFSNEISSGASWPLSIDPHRKFATT